MQSTPKILVRHIVTTPVSLDVTALCWTRQDVFRSHSAVRVHKRLYDFASVVCRSVWHPLSRGGAQGKREQASKEAGPTTGLLPKDTRKCLHSHKPPVLNRTINTPQLDAPAVPGHIGDLGTKRHSWCTKLGNQRSLSTTLDTFFLPRLHFARLSIYTLTKPMLHWPKHFNIALCPKARHSPAREQPPHYPRYFYSFCHPTQPNLSSAYREASNLCVLWLRSRRYLLAARPEIRQTQALEDPQIELSL